MMRKIKKKVQKILENLQISSTVFYEMMRGGETMIPYFLALNIIDGLLTLDQIKNKKLRKLVEKELAKMNLEELTTKEQD